jgi:flagellar hook-associated protein 2
MKEGEHMATNSINSTSSLLRLTGLGGSGLDTDTIVKQLMTAEKVPLNKLYQKRQLAEWKTDAYREITNKLRELKDTYFNTAKASSNIMSTSSFKKYTGTSTNSSYVTVSGNAEAVAGSHKVTVVSLASAGQAAGTAGVTDNLTGNAIEDDAYNLSGKSFNITLDGVSHEIQLGDYSSSKDTIGTQLQSLIDTAFGEGKITVDYDTSTKKLSFQSNTDNGTGRITLSSGKSSGLESLGFSSGATNRLDIYKSLEDLSTSFKNDLTFSSNGKLKFTINSKEFTFDKSESLAGMMNKINADADAKVTMMYDETTDKITITAKQTGAGANILIGTEQTGNFFGSGSASGIGTGNATTKSGQDASAIIDGQMITRSSNTFTLNGTTYTLVKKHENISTDSETVTLTPNVDEVYNNIKGFVDKYNEIISFINGKTTEKYDRDYQPLTSDEKEAMSEDEITTWETKAKTGLLRNDPMLQNIAYNLRKALYDSIDGVKTRLPDIGITTGEYYENGKLVINETKLKAAIADNPEAVSELFTKSAEKSYSASNTAALRSERYNTEGLANRISDILDDNIRTTNGKGLLLLKAGAEGDSTQYTSTLYEEIDDYDDAISAMVGRLNDKETAYYAKFTALEKYISQMSAQSSWISSQFGSSS